MEKIFEVQGKNGEGQIVVGNISKPSVAIEVEVKRLQLGSLLIENETALVVYKLDSDKPFLQFQGNKLLKLTNQNLINYIWEQQDERDIHNCLYKYTTDYKNNFLD